MNALSIPFLLCHVFLLKNPSPVNLAGHPPPMQDSIIRMTVHSNLMNEDRQLIIHFPRSYFIDSLRRFPVKYVLDGTSHDQHTADKLSVLSDAGLAPEAIIVALPNTRGNRQRDLNPPFMRVNTEDSNSAYGQGDKFLACLQKEIIPFIDSSFRTSSYRTLSGNSAGGLFVLYSLIETPDLFQARFCYSAPVWRFDRIMVQKVISFLSSSKLHSFLFISVGEKETENMRAGFTDLVSGLKKNAGRHFTWEHYQTPGAEHSDNAKISTSKGLAEWGSYFLKHNK